MGVNNIYTDTQREYRKSLSSYEEEYAFRLIVKETDLHIVLPKAYLKEQAEQKALELVLQCRAQLENYIRIHPEFYTAFSQNKVDKMAFPLIQSMQEAGLKLRVGAFAAVAGTVAEEVACGLHREMKKLNLECTDVLVENGGDIFLISEKKRSIGLLDNPKENQVFALSLLPTQGMSLCASSAFIGHSKSFGKAELVVVKAKQGSIADAAATSYGNILKSKKDFLKLEKIIIKDMKYGILGVFAKCDENFFMFGDMELEVL